MGFEDELAKWEAEKKGKASSPRKAESAPAEEFPDLSHLLGGDGQNEPDPAPTPAPPVAVAPAPAPRPVRDDYKVDIATSPADARRIAAEKAKSQNDTTAFGYGVARGATLGGIDRLVGLGTAIGEHLGASDAIPARPGAYQEGRAEYLAGEDKSRKISPVHHFLGEVAGGAALPAIAPASTLGRIAVSGAMGATAGALNTREDDASKMAKNAGIGAIAGGATEGTVGTVARKVVRNAPEREMKNTVAGIMESDAGRNAAGTGRELARNGKNVTKVLKDNPDARIAMRGEAKEALPVAEQKMAEAYAGQPQRYKVVDKTLKPLTFTGILGKLVKAESDKSIPLKQLGLVKDGLKSLRDSLRETVAPRWSGSETWDGKRLEVSTEQLREWVTSVQGAASPAFRGLHPSETAEAKATLARLANDILEERLDEAAKKGGKEVADVVAQIRDTDSKYSAWKTIHGALKERDLREQAQAMGISKRMSNAVGEAEMAAAGGLAMEGHIAPAVALAGKSLISRTADTAKKAIDYRFLVPIQDAAERGAPWAVVSRMAVENGLPQGVARALFDRTQKKKPLPAQPEPPAPMPAPDLVPVGRTAVAQSNAPVYPREYATTTRTQ